ncbi:MAG: hypothetical protein AAGE94_13480 [Acidobacteriota bacterium]
MPSLPETFPDLPTTLATPFGVWPLEGVTALLLGLLLLTLGRRLFWLVLLGTGFLAGLLAADHLVQGVAPDVRLVAALAAGVAGAVLAFVAQKVAVLLAGFLAGAATFFSLLPWLWPDVGTWIWPASIVGGLLGLGFANALFDLALLLLTCSVGALLVARALPLDTTTGAIVAGVLFVVGLLIQGRRDLEEDDD